MSKSLRLQRLSKSIELACKRSVTTQATPPEGEHDNISITRSILEARSRRQLILNELSNLGSTQTRENTFQPHHPLHRAQESTTLSQLIAAGAHLGHNTALTNEAAYSAIYGTRNGISIIDVRQTLSGLKRACGVMRSVVEQDGTVVFVGGTQAVVDINAKRLGENGFGTVKWRPGTISNATQIFQTTKVFKPSLLVLLTPLANVWALREATAANIPTIGLIDSNVDPRSVTYPIPANDDSVRTMELIAGVLAMAGKQGLEIRQARQTRATSSKGEQGYKQRRIRS